MVFQDCDRIGNVGVEEKCDFGGREATLGVGSPDEFEAALYGAVPRQLSHSNPAVTKSASNAKASDNRARFITVKLTASVSENR